MLAYPSVWKENRVVTPIIEVKVWDQIREESLLDFEEGNEKRALDTTHKQENVGDEVDVYISPIDSKSMLILLNAKN